MKSYNGLYDAMLDHGEMVETIKDAAHGKHKRKCVQRALNDIDAAADRVIQAIKDGTWRVDHTPRCINEGSYRKNRVIFQPQWDAEQIVHHAMVHQLKKVMQPRMYSHSYGATSKDELYRYNGTIYRKASGPHRCKKTVWRWVRGYKGKRFYVAELDIRKFYSSVDHAILIKLAGKHIRDKRFLDLVSYAIEPFDGLPLGNVLSPWLSSLYLMEMDEYILQELKPDHYARYVDNLWLMSTNKRKLHRMVKTLTERIGADLHLTFGTRQVYRFEDAKRHARGGRMYRHGRAIDCLGFVIHRDRVSVRKSILKRARRKALRIARKGALTWYDAAQILSRMSYIRQANATKYFEKWIQPHVSIAACKRLVSSHMRRIVNVC